MATRAGPERRVLALAGPTACGKSAAALAIARAHEAEIVSVDSALVYRGMDIGTAKPSAAERAAVPHHLIDIRDPLQPYSAAEFAADAQRLVAEINARGKLALLAGGTMLYFKALFEGLDAMPAADAHVRAQIEAEAATKGWPAMHAELAKADPPTAARLAPADAQRIQRALEVFRLSGRPLSSFHARTYRADPGGWHSMPLFSLEPEDRGWLHERIAQRFEAMLAAGFIDEVRALRARGDLNLALPSMRCVGYRQAWEILDAYESGPAGAPFPMQQLREKGIFATRQLAKRQLTWLRGMTGRRVIACDGPDALAQLLQQVRRIA
jgi:tRNA dimethylallyltransferase